MLVLQSLTSGDISAAQFLLSFSLSLESWLCGISDHNTVYIHLSLYLQVVLLGSDYNLHIIVGR